MNELEISFDLKDIDRAAEDFLEKTKGFKVFTFSGELGAGKTTFIAALCRHSGVTEIVSSPTFSIIQQYTTSDGKNIYHMDLYRIRDEEEAINSGLEDCVLSGDICMIEWPENAPDILPLQTVETHITIESDTKRKLLVIIPK